MSNLDRLVEDIESRLLLLLVFNCFLIKFFNSFFILTSFFGNKFSIFNSYFVSLLLSFKFALLITLNILFLDEIFSSLDQNNITRIVHILRKIAKDYNMNIMVINHSPLPTELFDWTISTSIKDNFSNLLV